MFYRLLLISSLFFADTTLAAKPRVMSGLINPESVILGPDSRIYISQIGEFNKDDDGSISVLDPHRGLEIFTPKLNDPKGLAVWRDHLYVTDKKRILKIDSKGKAVEWVSEKDFPQAPLFLNDLVFDSKGVLYVSDTGNLEQPGKGAIFKITGAHQVSLVINEEKNPSFMAPNGLLMEGDDKLLVLDFANGELNQLNLKTLETKKLLDGLGPGGDGLVRDKTGLLYFSNWIDGKVYRFDPTQTTAKPLHYKKKFKSAADITLDAAQKYILVPDMKAGTLTWLPK